ncbi:hypothetical protein MM300_00035 [Evansella sp. LMS18]|uniref:hypothetical protein n=1 Tax=Evansella sp. LMS18 TaxID=2924033 RepID=UPI0020D05776|nr:hypothetical protein [Evansella sp. LMS18]UTR10765.1 hypothetical protein MM300_00035 [Evansella sp. LMS18]
MTEPFITWSVGPFTISAQMLFIFIAAASGYGAMSLYLKEQRVGNRGEILDTFLTSLIICAVVYKMWPFILDPKLLTSPGNLLYFAGGPYAAYASAGAAVIYFLLQSVRKKWSHHSLDSFMAAITTALIVFSLGVKKYGLPSPFSFGYIYEGVIYHPVNFYYSWLFLLVLLAAVLLVPSSKKYARSITMLTGLVIAYGLAAPFQV